MRKGWDDALELQNQLKYALNTDDWSRTLAMWGYGQGKGTNYMEFDLEGSQPIQREGMRFIASVAALTAVGTSPGDFVGEDSVGRRYMETLPTGIEVVPMWVNNEVIDLVEYASQTFRPEALIPSDLVVPNAFCVFERALRANDIEGREISFRAASWGHFTDPARDEQKTGIIMALWTHKDDEDDYSRKHPEVYHRRMGGSPLHLMQVSMFPWGDKRAMVEPANHKLFAQLQVLWRMAQQQITLQSERQVSRPTWRHKQNWRQIKTVQVLVLRRPKTPRYEGDADEAHYSHRFPVHGHWRNQWYPSEKVHRQIWINSFVKGPADAPFVAKRQAAEFIR